MRNNNIVNVCAVKKAPDHPVGVQFLLRALDNAIVVNSIATTSLFANSGLKVGMIVKKVNDIDANDLDLKQVEKLLREAKGLIKIAASSQNITGSATESVPRQQPGYLATPAPEPPSNINCGAFTARCGSPSSTGATTVRRGLAATMAHYRAKVEAHHAANVGAESNLASLSQSNTMKQIRGLHKNRRMEGIDEHQQEPNIRRSSTLRGLAKNRRGSTHTPHHHARASPAVNNLSPMVLPVGFVEALDDSENLVGIPSATCIELVPDASEVEVITATATIPTPSSVTGFPITDFHSAAIQASEVDWEATVTSNTGIVTTSVTKARYDCDVGLEIDQSVANYYGELGFCRFPIISTIHPNGLFANSHLRQGMRVLSINGVSCRGRDDTIAMLRMAQGKVTLVAGQYDMISATVRKPTLQTKVGLRIAKEGGILVVAELLPCGLFAQTDLKKGMEILQVDGVDVTDRSPTFVSNIIQSSLGNITVLARENRATSMGASTTGRSPALRSTTPYSVAAPPRGITTGGHLNAAEYVISATVTKPTQQAKVGLTIAKEGGILVIAEVLQCGLFAQTDLKKGMEILQVNGVDVRDRSPTFVFNIIQSSLGNVTVLAKGN